MNKEVQTSFTNIANCNAWGNRESISGPGSTIKNTEKLRKQLSQFISDLYIQSICDIPCGDFNWQPELLKSCPGIKRYIGCDIVHNVLEVAKQKHEMCKADLQHVECSFEVADLLTHAIPKTDLLLVRDCLVHLPNELVADALANVLASKCKYFATTCFGRVDMNRTLLQIGDWRKLDLCLEPFNWNEPLAKIKERECHKWLYIWNIDDIRSYMLNK